MKRFWILSLSMTLLFMLVGAENSFAQRNSTKWRAKKETESRATQQDIILYSGLQSTYDLPFIPCFFEGGYERCVRVANKSVVEVLVDKERKQLLLTPQKKGETNIHLRDENGDLKLILKIFINESNLVRKVQELKNLLKDIEGIEMKIVSDKIVVDGEVVAMQDLNRLYAVLSDSAYKDTTMNLVTVSPVGLQIFAEKIQTEVNNPNVKVRVMNNLFILEGQVDNDGDKERAFETAKNLIPGYTKFTYAYAGTNNPIDVKVPKEDPRVGIIVNRIVVAKKEQKPEPPKMIRLTIDFVELSKDYIRNFGFSWMPSLDTSAGSISFGQSTTGGVTTSGSGSLSGTIMNLFPKLATAQNAGYARILEESIILVENDKQAELNREVQIPYTSTSTNSNGTSSTSISTQNIGPKINIKPKMIDESNVNMEISFNYNGFGGKSGTQLIIINHQFKSTFTIKNNESAAIVNAMGNTISTAFNKDPPGGIPNNPLFTLYRSKAFSKNKTQFVVFVTPQIIDSASQGTDDIKQRYGFKRKL